MSNSQGRKTFLERVWVASEYVRCHVSAFPTSSSSCVEAPISLRPCTTSQDILRLQRGCNKVKILSGNWHHTWSASKHWANFANLVVFHLVEICWHQRICYPFGFEISMGHISIVYVVILMIATWSCFMPSSSLSSHNIIQLKDISC